MDEGDILDMVIRKSYVEKLVEKRKEDIKNAPSPITPISANTELTDFDINDFLFDDDDEEEDDVSPEIKVEPIEEYDPIKEYEQYLYNLDERTFMKICIKEGIVNPDHVFD